MTRPSVLVVEDEAKIAALIRDYLAQSDFSVHVIDDGAGVVDWVRQHSPDIITLDVMLPGVDGLTILRELRAFSDVPVLLITARVEDVDRLVGLELGADDYICKPFNPREVVLRVKAIWRRAAASTQPDAAYRDVNIDHDGFSATVGGTALELTPVEFRLLALLSANPRRVYSRDHLIDNIYLDGRVVSDRTVDSHAKNLRKKLVEATGEEDWIRSIYGVGYKLD
ncbi:MAG: response regulator [Pseudomonadota bacterium]